MNEAAAGDHRDDAGPQRPFVIDEDEIGAASRADNAAIGKVGGPRGCR